MSPFTSVSLSLADVVGKEVLRGCCAARALLTGEAAGPLEAAAFEPLTFYSQGMHNQLVGLLEHVGDQVIDGVSCSPRGATTLAFDAATHVERAPLSGYGWYRVGEDGRLYLASKSEHYHASLGHAFPGYQLIDRARRLGIPNATHNNTRGAVTRRAEEELARVANGVAPGDAKALASCLESEEASVLNCVLNLQTGSLAAEAALKLALARFYRQDGTVPDPAYEGRTPVFIVLGDDDGGLQANYHGTTITAQLLRGLWPQVLEGDQTSQQLQVCAVRPNRAEDLEEAFTRWDRPPYKVAAFIHEIIMMNYGARRLTPEFLQRAYELSVKHDALTIVDEIQSCVWGDGLFSFREWDLQPSMVVVGKGFPGGEYAGSRILFNRSLDVLPQFGALVTNGQEELTSLAYLVTIAWAEANQEQIMRIGTLYEQMLRGLAARYPAALHGFEGCRHLGALSFRAVDLATAFAVRLSEAGIDISVQSYKESCPPVALTKLPLTVDEHVVGFLEAQMVDALEALS